MRQQKRTNFIIEIQAQQQDIINKTTAPMITKPSEKLHSPRLNQLLRKDTNFPALQIFNDDKMLTHSQKKSMSLNQFKQNVYEEYEQMSSTPKKYTVFQRQENKSLKAVYRLRKMIQQFHPPKEDDSNSSPIKLERKTAKKFSDGIINDALKYSVEKQYRKQSKDDEASQMTKIKYMNAVLAPITSVDKHFTLCRSGQQKYKLNLSHSQIVPLILNPQQLIKFAKSQVKENNKRILERLQHEKRKEGQKSSDKRIHEKSPKAIIKTESHQVIEHIIRKDFPIQISTNRIVIPRINHKQRWMDKLLKLKYTENVRQRTVRKQRAQLKNITEAEQDQVLANEKNIRIMTDIIEVNVQNSKQSSIRKRYWDNFHEESIQPWGFQ